MQGGLLASLAVPGTWRDGDDEGDDTPSAPPVHPDDRLWRHPSEIAGPLPSRSSPPSTGPGRSSGARTLSWAVTSGLTGAVLALGLVATTVGISDGDREQVLERVERRGELADTTVVADNDLVSMAGSVTASVVRLEIETPTGPAAGSGVVLFDDGHLVTSAALIEGATAIAIVLANGETVPAHLVGADALTDIAVVAPDASDEGRRWEPAMRGAADELAVGEPAMAVGSPPTAGAAVVSVGVVSALGRRMSTRTGLVLHGMIQTDAPIAADAGGGALCDRTGRVVGIMTPSPAADGASPGFATPMETAWAIAESLIADGAVHHVWLGIEGADLDATQSSILGISGTSAGAVVNRVMAGSPAEAAGLRAGDALIALDGQPLASMSDLVMALRDYQPGDEITLAVHRGGVTERIPVTLAERETEGG